MADQTKAGAKAPAEPKMFKISLSKPVMFRGVLLSPRDHITVAEDALPELGDAVSDAKEV